MADILQRFLDEQGRLVQWPAKYTNQRLVLEYLITKFAQSHIYREREVNEILQNWHTYGDWATLRRALVDDGLLTRKHDGSEYRRVLRQQ